jgi:hypothetical protein
MKHFTREQWRLLAHTLAGLADDIHDSGDGVDYCGYSEQAVLEVMEIAKHNWQVTP